MLQKPAYDARRKYGIRFEDAFKPDTIEQKYALSEAEDVL